MFWGIKEQDKTPEENPREMETRALPNIEFKVMTIKICNAFRRNNEDNQEKNFSRTSHILCENCVLKSLQLYLEIWMDFGYKHGDKIK